MVAAVKTSIAAAPISAPAMMRDLVWDLPNAGSFAMTFILEMQTDTARASAAHEASLLPVRYRTDAHVGSMFGTCLVRVQNTLGFC
jgi:hypothetical protein